MGFGLWKKIKEGARKVFGGIGKTVSTIGKTLLPEAGGFAAGLAEKYIPSLGKQAGRAIRRFTGADEPEDNELLPILKDGSRGTRPMVGANGHGIRNLMV
jgi:hypothetical protein